MKKKMLSIGAIIIFVIISLAVVISSIGNKLDGPSNRDRRKDQYESEKEAERKAREEKLKEEEAARREKERAELKEYEEKKKKEAEELKKKEEERKKKEEEERRKKEEQKKNNYTPGITTHTSSSKMDYFLYLPEAYVGKTESIPIIVYLHGTGMRIDKAPEGLMGDIKSGLKKVNAIVIAPNTGLSGRNPDSMHFEGWLERSNDVIETIKEVAGKYNGNMNRVYIAGYSNGAQGAFNVLLKHPTIFKAIAVANGPSYLNGFSKSKESDDDLRLRFYNVINDNKIGVYLIRVDGDQNVPSDGGYSVKKALLKYNYPDFKYDYTHTVKGENTHHLAYDYFTSTDYVEWLLAH